MADTKADADELESWVNTTLQNEAQEAIEYAPQTGATTDQFVANQFQREILNALEGRAMKKQALADEVCGGEGSRLYRSGRKRKGDLNELRDLGRVAHKVGLGYYRPDALPR